MGMTPEGCGLEFAAKRLIARKEARKILICMTDGSPGCHDLNYTNEPNAPTLSIASAWSARSKLRASISWASASSTTGRLATISNSMVIQNVGEMPKLLMGVLKKFIVG
jgi:nitric oxide reductase activation protein